MSAYKRNQSLRVNKKLLVALFLVGVLTLAGLTLKLRSASPPNNTQPSADGKPVNLNPPTEQEIAETEAHKKDLAQSSPPAPSSSGKKQVTPVITNASKAEITAYIPVVFEEGGTCTATLTKGDKTITKTSKGFGNVSYTSCEPINVAGSLDSGSWTVIVSYSSSAAEGKSAPKVFTVN